MDGYLTVEETARRLDRSIEQVRRYLREGRLPGRRIGQQWFIEETVLSNWRPERRGAGAPRVSEAVAAYEARPMRTDETRRNERLVLEEWLRRIDAIAAKIRRESGGFDVVEMLRRDREEH